MTQHDEVNKPPVKKLTRIPEGKMVGGVCTGLADYLSIDVTLVRLGVAVVSLITAGAGVIAYIVGMVVIPERGAEGSAPPPPPPPSSTPPPTEPPPSAPPPSAPGV